MNEHIVDIRTQVDCGLAHPLSDEEWAYLVRERHIRALVEGQRTVGELTVLVQRFRAIFGAAEPSPARTHLRLTPLPSKRFTQPGQASVSSGDAAVLASSREQALASLLAEHARNDEAVRTFRADVLQGSVISWDEVQPWLDRQRASERIHLVLTRIVATPQSKDQMLDLLEEQINAQANHGSQRATREPLQPESSMSRSAAAESVTPVIEGTPVRQREASITGLISDEMLDEHVERHILLSRLLCLARDAQTGQTRIVEYVTGQGTLGRLGRLVQRLVLLYPWEEAAATRFVLTDIPPMLLRVQAEAIVDERLSACSRISMTLDPTLSPAEVAQQYRTARKQILGSRYRDLSEKHARLAAFALTAQPTETGAQRMSKWNHDHPDWAYTHVTNFLRDTAQAQRRLLHPDIRLPRAHSNSIVSDEPRDEPDSSQHNR